VSFRFEVLTEQPFLDSKLISIFYCTRSAPINHPEDSIFAGRDLGQKNFKQPDHALILDTVLTP
jgi:hypothetical protein